MSFSGLGSAISSIRRSPGKESARGWIRIAALVHSNVPVPARYKLCIDPEGATLVLDVIVVVPNSGWLECSGQRKAEGRRQGLISSDSLIAGGRQID